MNSVFRTFLPKNGVLLICKALIYQGFFVLLIGDMHSKTLRMRNDYFYARPLFKHGFLANSNDVFGMLCISFSGMDGHVSPVV